MGYTPHGNTFLVVASNRGRDTMPAWYLNLRATPEVTVEVGSRQFRARAEQVPAEERAAVWTLVTERLPEYQRLQRKTSRSFPIIRLTPLETQ
jgi:deazaflavin-dependent oxidoreductase (nitroreductase family)